MINKKKLAHYINQSKNMEPILSGKCGFIFYLFKVFMIDNVPVMFGYDIKQKNILEFAYLSFGYLTNNSNSENSFHFGEESFVAHHEEHEAMFRFRNNVLITKNFSINGSSISRQEFDVYIQKRKFKNKVKAL